MSLQIKTRHCYHGTTYRQSERRGLSLSVDHFELLLSFESFSSE